MSTTIHPNERSTQLLWMGFIIMFFMLQAILWTVAILFTMNDSSHAIIPNYEQKAVHWDQSQTALRASEALGIRSTLSVDADPDLRGVRTVRLKLLDAEHKPVAANTISLKAFHVGRAAEVQEIVLVKSENLDAGVDGKSEADDDFTGSVLIDKTGHWSITGSVLVDSDLYFIDQRVFIEK